MAATVVIDATEVAIDLETATSFTTTQPCVIDAVGCSFTDYVVVYKLMSTDEYYPITDINGVVKLSAFPNVRVLEAPGTYKFVIPNIPSAPITVGYEEFY